MPDVSHQKFVNAYGQLTRSSTAPCFGTVYAESGLKPGNHTASVCFLFRTKIEAEIGIARADTWR